VGRSRSAASNLLRLLKLPDEIQMKIMSGALDMGHGRALLSLDGARQIAAANKICLEGLSVRETEKLIQKWLNPETSQPRQITVKSRDVLRLQEELSERMGTNVTIKEKNKGAGQLVIDYDNHEQLDELIANLQKI